MAAYFRRVQIIGHLLCLLDLCIVFSVVESGVVPEQKDNQNVLLNADPKAIQNGQGLPVVPKAQNFAPGLDQLKQKLENPPVADGLNRPSPNIGKGVLLATHPDCQEDVARLCDTIALKKNNFAVLECLQADMEVQV